MNKETQDAWEYARGSIMLSIEALGELSERSGKEFVTQDEFSLLIIQQTLMLNNLRILCDKMLYANPQPCKKFYQFWKK